MELLIKIGAIYNLGFAVFHLLFWRIFRWKRALRPLTPLNRAIVQTLNLCLSFVFLMFGYLSLFYSRELITTPLGRATLYLLALFWLARAVEQVIFFELRTRASVTFLAAFLAGCLLYLIPAVFG